MIFEGRFRVIDLFAGIGGMTCGFVQTGRFEPVFAVEIEPAFLSSEWQLLLFGAGA